MGIYVPWLADAAKLTGYPVVEVPSWQQRGHGPMRVVEGVVGHHTANPQLGDYPSLRIVRDGRADLAGPLANLGLGRDGTVFVIAAGLCYHAGASKWAGFTDLNDEFLGIEAESSGLRDDWTTAQRDCYPRLIASLLFYMRRGADRFAFHKEVCRPPGRKPDAAYFNGADIRNRVAWMLEDPLHRICRGIADIKPVIRRKPTMDQFFVSGNGTLKLNCSVGKASATVSRAWLIASLKSGTGSFRVFAQDDDSGINDWAWDKMTIHDGRSDRRFEELRDGTTQIVVQYVIDGEATLTLELMPK